METQSTEKRDTISKDVVQKPKRSKVFPIILLLLIIAGAWFGISKYIHGQHHEETDDAQVEANISPVIPRVSGYVSEVRVKDNQRVHKGDTLIILDQRDLRIRVEQAEAALATAQSNLGAARTTTTAARSNIATSQASVGAINAQIEAAKINLWRANQDHERYANLIKDHSITQQQYEQALAAKQTAEQQLRILQEQKKPGVFANKRCNEPKWSYRITNTCCKFGYKAAPGRGRRSPPQSFICHYYCACRWIGF